MYTYSDYELITSLMQHSEPALESIYNKYAERIYKFSFFLLKDTGMSEDAVQEVFVKLWDSRSKLDPEGNLWTFLYVLAKRITLNKLRSYNRSEALMDNIWNNISQKSECPHEKLIAKELSKHLEWVLQELPDRQRQVFTLSRFEGFSHQEIAQQLDISPNTVKNHMIQALKIIRKQRYDVDFLLVLIWSLV